MTAVADGAGARVSRDEQGSRRHARAAARCLDRRRSPPDVAAVPRRRRLRAAHLLRQRGQPAPGTRDGTHARAGDTVGARRRAWPRHPAAPDRKPRALDGRRRPGRGRRRGDSEHRAIGDSARGCCPRRSRSPSTCASSRSVARRRFSSGCCSASLRRGRPPSSRRRRRSPPTAGPQPAAAGESEACSSSERSRPPCCCSSAPACCCARCIAVESVDRGYRAERVLTMMVDPLGSRYPTAAALLQFFDAVEREVTALPGVRSVAWTSTLPLGASDAGQSFFEIAGDPPVDESQRPIADYQIVSPAYFRTLDLPVVAGRGFDDRDTTRRRPGLHRERSVRPRLSAAADRRSACGWPFGRPTSAQAPPVRAGDRRRRSSGEGPARRDRGPRSDLCPDGAEPRGRHLSGRPARRQDAPKGCAFGPCGDRRASTRSNW